MKRLLILLAFLVFPSLVHAREGWRDWCQMGNRNVVTSGLNSTTKVQQSFPQCTITIYVHGGGKAKIYNDNNGTEKANPFTSDLDGQFIWYADNGRYDQTTTSAGMPQPITMSDILLCDPADAAGGSCGTVNGGAGCTLPGLDTGVLSEHPAGTCYDSVDWTWDDGSGKQNMQAGLLNVVGTGNNSTFQFGDHNEIDACVVCGTMGSTNSFTTPSGGMFGNFAVGFNNTIVHSSPVQIYGDVNTIAGQNSIEVWIMGTSNQFNTANTAGQIENSTFIESNTTATVDGANAHITDVQSIGSSDIFTVGQPTGGRLNQLNCLHGIGGSNSFVITGGLGVDTAISATSWVGKNNQFTATGFDISDMVVAANNVSIGTSTDLVNHAGAFGNLISLDSCHNCYAFGENINQSTSQSVAVGISAQPEIVIKHNHVALNAHLDQTAAGTFGNKCAMSAGTTCTFSIAVAYTGTPLCVTSIDAASAVPATANVAKCSVSGTTVTITAGIANSLTWDAILVGNPN